MCSLTRNDTEMSIGRMHSLRQCSDRNEQEGPALKSHVKLSPRHGNISRKPFNVSIAVQSVLRERRLTALVSSAGILLLGTTAVAQQQPSPGEGESQEPVLTEIVVTAQKRSQSLQDVPYNISAIGSGALRDAGAVSIDSLTQLVPGLMNVDEGPADRGGNNNFILRGLRTNSPGGGSAGAVYQNLTVSPVSTYFGETPVYFQMPLDDIERVEVLRGPQGTLYGSGSQAGTIRFIPKRPEFGQLSGDLSVDGSYTQYAPGANGGVHGVVNLPIADNLALRVVAGEDHLAGFIKAVDRVATEPNGTPVPSIPGDLTSGFVLDPVRKGVNSSDQWFARAALRWQPVDSVDLQFDLLHQHTSMADGQWGSAWPGGPVNSSLGYYPNTTVDTRAGCQFCSTNLTAEPFSDSIGLYDLVGSVDLGLATVTSATSYYDDKPLTGFDQTGIAYGTAVPPNPNGSNVIPYFPYNNYPRITFPTRQRSENSTFIEELRLVSAKTKAFDYVLGLYFEHQDESAALIQTTPGINAYLDATNQPSPTTFGDQNYFYQRKTEFLDRAIFGELTYHLTEAWQFTGGVRFFRQTFNSDVNTLLPLCGAICSYTQADPTGLTATSSTTTFSNHVWKANTSYDFSPTLKVYATFSEGFRHGGVSGLSEAGPFASPADLQDFKPDLAKNYEIGVKGSLLNHQINYFADIYMVNVYNFQFDTLSLGGLPGAYNGSEARSQGLEFESQFVLTDHLNGSIGYAFTRAYVVDSFDILDYPPYALIPSQGGNGQLASLFGGALPAGTKLPGVSQDVVNASVEYTLPATHLGDGGWTWKYRLDGSYRSAQNSNINPQSFYEFTIPSAFIGNARVSLESKAGFSYSAYVQNITNNADVTGGEFGQEFASLYRLRNVGRPRTFGLAIRYSFGRQ